VLNEDYWRELRQGLGRHSLDVFHVVLHADPDILAQRINADQDERTPVNGGSGTSPATLPPGTERVVEAVADLVVDSTTRSVPEVAAAILKAVQARG